MKKFTILVLLMVCLGMAGCSKDAEVTAFMTELETVTNEMSKNLEEGKVDDAKKSFDAKKDSLKTKWDGIKTARNFQVSEATRKKMEDDMKKNVTTLTSAVQKGVSKVATDKAAVDKMQALMKDYVAIFQM